jgi:hypothetical protein
MKTSRVSQHGAVLLVSLILLVLLTIFVLSAILMSNTNLRIVGNTQARTEAMAAAQQAIEQVISRNFPDNPLPATVNIDINADGATDYTVSVIKPVCQNIVPIKIVDLDIIARPADRECNISTVLDNPGEIGIPSGNSQCSNTQWDVEAQINDTARTGVVVNVHQGIGERVRAGTVCP